MSFGISRFSVVSVALVAVLSFASSALAWNPPGGAHAVGRVAEIQVYSDGSFNFSLVGSPALCAAGTSNTRGGVRAEGSTTAEGVRTLHATLMSAMLSGRQVRVYANNNDGLVWGCRVGAVDFF
jgi:hypothetical protein